MRTDRAAFADGVRMGCGAAAPVFVLALTYGAAAADSGWGVTTPVLFSLFAFSGSAQFTLLAALGSGSTPAAVLAAVLINARYVVMSVAVNDSLQGGRMRRAVVAQALVDASFALAHRGDGRFDVARLLGASLPQWVCWVAGTAVGALTAPPDTLMHDLGLDVAFPAFFLMLALGELRSSGQARAAAALGGLVAGGLLFVTSPANALLAAVAGVVVGLRPHRGRAEGRPR